MTIALVKIANVDDRLVPLGLACLQAYLKQNNVPVKVFCFRPSSYSLAKFMINPLSAVAPPTLVMNHTVFPILAHMVNVVNNGKELDFTKGIFLDLIRDYCSLIHDSGENMIQRYKSMMKYLHTIVPQLINYSTIGFSVDYLNIVETVMATVFIRKIKPSIQIIWGGPSITQSKEAFTYFLKKEVCDGLVIGEGEHPILQITRGIPLDKVKGVMSFDGNNIIYDHGVQLNLDDLPTPDYTDIPIKSFFNIVSIYRSRGCTNRCSFCAEWFLFGPKFRRRSINKVIQDIEMVIEKWKPGYIIFGESLINDDLEYFEQLCDKMIEKNFEMKFGTHFRADITPKIAKKAYCAGFNDAWVGLEAFSDKELEMMNKGITTNQNIEAIYTFTKAGMNVIAMLVVGVSNEKFEEENSKNTIKLIKMFSKERIVDEQGRELPLSIQFRPAPMCVVPGSMDFKNQIHPMYSWKCKEITPQNKMIIKNLESSLSEIPYTFTHPIPANNISELIQRALIVDKNSGFRIGGVLQYAINEVIRQRKEARKERKNVDIKMEQIGIGIQRSKNYC